LNHQGVRFERMLTKRFSECGLVAACAWALFWCAISHGAEKWVWDIDRGWLKAKGTRYGTYAEQFDYGVTLMVDERFANAEYEFRKLAERTSNRELVLQCMLRRAECLYRMGRLWDAFKLAEKCYAEVPLKDRERIIRLEYAMGRAGVKTLDKHTPKILERARDHQVGGELADRCQFEIGEYYLAAREYEPARRAYDALRERYPRSNLVGEAAFSAGLCCLLMSQHVLDRVGMLREARKRFDAYIAASPEGDKTVQARRHLATIKSIELAASKAVVNFYYALLLFNEGQYDRALPAFEYAAKKMEGSDTGEQAQYYRAECLFRQEKYGKAFKEFQRLFDEYPVTRYCVAAAEREFRIAQIMEKERKDPAKALKIYMKVVEHAPNAGFADDAQLKIGDCYFALNRLSSAKTAYRVLSEAYPDSEWTGVAMLQIGRCNLEEAKMVNAGVSLALSAQEKFEEYIMRYPDGVKVKEAKRWLREVREFLAKDSYEVAKFYLRVKRKRAAMLYFRSVAREYPGTSWAAKAQERLRAMEVKPSA